MRRRIPSEYVKPFLASGNRRHLKGGMEFPAFIAAVWASVMILASLQNRWGVFFAILSFAGICALGRAMAERDPYMTDIYLDALEYKDFYTALPQAPRTVFLVKGGRS